VHATAIVPIKRFGAAKSRLGDAVSVDARRELAGAMLADVLAALERCDRMERVIVVSGEPAARGAARAAAVEWLDDPDDSGHPEAAMIGVRSALAAGDGCVALLPGDCPLLRADELDGAIKSMHAGVAGVAPDRNGSGTNGLLLAPPDAIRPAFGPGSRKRHLELARRSGVEPRVVEIPSLALDLDTPEDLAELRRVLEEDPAQAPTTAAVLSGIGAAAPETKR